MSREEFPENLTVNPGYASHRIAKAQVTAQTHGDAATRERALEKILKWHAVLEGMRDGTFQIGSRQPTSAPVWATPEVVTGGFVTGKLMAGGPLMEHERDLQQRMGGSKPASGRGPLNEYYLLEAGLTELVALLRSGHYSIKVPEEGALLVLAWLVTEGHTQAGQVLIQELAPHFTALRFYPQPADRPAPTGSRVCLETLGTVRERMRSIQPNARILTQREAIQIWTPLYGKMIALFLETVMGPPPLIVPDSEGRWTSTTTRKFHVSGGWPCQHFAEDWKPRARQLVADVEKAQADHPICRKPLKEGDSFARLFGFIKTCAADSDQLKGRDVGMIRLIVARHLTKRGLPGSPKSGAVEACQEKQVSGPLLHEIARLLYERLASLPADSGIDELDVACHPVTAEETRMSGVPSGTIIPHHLGRKIERCLRETTEVLVERGVITSGEVLARLIPQFTADIESLGFHDPALRRLLASIHRAFRRRRSLLLLNLQSQVRPKELPWVAAVEPFRQKDSTAREPALRALGEVSALALRAFPQAIIPNKLLQEFRALAKTAELDVPLTEELAADIFMGAFSPKFTEAARLSGELIDGSLYARYFDVACSKLRGLPETQSGRSHGGFRSGGGEQADPLVQLCKDRAGISESGRWNVARNGMIIEQVQILTTHNLAVLFGTLGLAESLRGELPAMAEKCFRWICRRLQIVTDNRHASLITLKNTAYAWRQMVFYLSNLPAESIDAFLSWAVAHLKDQPEPFQVRFLPAIDGLAFAHAGGNLDAAATESGKLRRFLGWTQGPHWLSHDLSTPKA